MSPKERPHLSRWERRARPAPPDPETTRERVLRDTAGTARLLFDLEAVDRVLSREGRPDLVSALSLVKEAKERGPSGLLPASRRSPRRLPSAPRPLTCLVADDHPIVSRAVSDILVRQGVDVVAVAGTGRQAADLIAAHRPAVALVDLRLPDIDGAEVARRASGAAPETGVILYTGVDAGLLAAALESGARGFLLKDAPLGDLPRAVTMVAEGEIYLDPALLSFLVNSPAARGLDGREIEILRLLAAGLTAEEIAGRLFFSAETVRADLRRAMAKLGAHTRSQAVATAVRTRLIS